MLGKKTEQVSRLAENHLERIYQLLSENNEPVSFVGLIEQASLLDELKEMSTGPLEDVVKFALMDLLDEERIVFTADRKYEVRT